MGDVRGLLGDLGVPVERQLGDELRVRCLDPGHDDERASMDVHVETGNVNCRSCPAGGRVASLVKMARPELEAREVAQLLDRYGFQNGNGSSGSHPPAPARTPKGTPETEETIAEYRQALKDNKDAISAMTARGWTGRIARDLELGVGKDGRITIPLREDDGQLAGCLYYSLNGRKPKMLALPGTRRVLFPNPNTISGDTVWIVEGEADAIAAHSVGLPAVGVGGASNWKSEFAESFKDKNVILVPDCDDPGRELRDTIVEALHGVAASVKTVDLEGEDGYDLTDALLAGETAETLLTKALPDTTPPIRHHAVTKTPLHKRVVSDVSDVSEVTALLGDVAKFIELYVILARPEQITALALFVAHTWAFDAAHATPYLNVESAEKQSGKTRLLEVLGVLVRMPEKLTGTSESALFRLLGGRPTVLLDEVDTIFQGNSERNEGLRGLLNSGNRPGATVARVANANGKQEVVKFPVYAPKVLAGIYTYLFPDTIRDRSIPIVLRRKPPDVEVQAFRYRDVEVHAEPLRDRLAAWATDDTLDVLREARPDFPEGLSDRAEEAWEPLLAIADHAGGDWPQIARHAAAALLEDHPDDAESLSTIALRACREAFQHETAYATKILLAYLNDDDELPFGGFNQGAGLDGRGLNRLLSGYKIKPKSVRPSHPIDTNSGTTKGYTRSQFEEAWASWLPIGTSSELDTSDTNGHNPHIEPNLLEPNRAQTGHTPDTKGRHDADEELF